MAFLIDQLNNSGLFAQSAYSAGIATCDSDGNVITATYLTAHQQISADEWNSTYETVQTNSGSWASETFTGVDTDSTLTGDGLNNPLGIAEVQTLSSDETISITSANDVVTLGVNGTWFNDAVNSAVTGTQGDAEVNTYVHNNSATIDNVNTTVQTNSGSWGQGGGTIESYDLSAGDNIQIIKDDVNSAIGISVTGLNQANWNNSYTALTSNSANWNNTRTVVYNYSANWNNTRSTVQSNSARWAQGTTYTEGDGIDITNNVISLDSPIVFSAGSGLSVTMDSNTARLDVTAQGGGGTSYTGDAQGALDEVYTNSGTWNSYGSDISYLSATIGDVESLLAQL